MSDMTREEQLDWLYRLKSHVTTFMPKIWHEKFIEALGFAISSLETDEAYNLMYEQPEFCEDAISRKELLAKLEEWDQQELYLPIHFKENIIDELPSVLPKTTKNDLHEVIQQKINSIKAESEPQERSDKE